jgi:hypothetical protein
MPGDGQVPYMSTLADRLYQRLPEIYRSLDAADSTWTFKRYIGAICDQAGMGDDFYVAVLGDRPIGPATPVPWNLEPDQLAVWQAARVSRLSSMGDPLQADSSWLPWLAQLVGAKLDPTASDAEQRDTILFATSGWRAGTAAAMEDAARSALTGSRYAQVLPATAGSAPGTPWDITIVTRATETPDPSAVIGAVLRKGVKPAGVTLHTRSFGSSWATVEAVRPTWFDWNTSTWAQIEESGLSYADVPDNLMVNPSFELGTTGWTALNASTLSSLTGGIDGAKYLGITSTTTATHTGVKSAAVIGGILPGREYLFGYSATPPIAIGTVTLSVAWTTSGGGAISTTIYTQSATTSAWQRIQGSHLAPTGAANAEISIDFGTIPISDVIHLDAGLFRLVS